MSLNLHRTIRFCSAVALLLSFMAVRAQAQRPSNQEPRKMHATGPFEVKIIPQDGTTPQSTLGRMLLDKTYHGDLEATGKGQMLSAATPVKGSGAYVAIERVAGTLHGRTGSFTLQHTGSMTQGKPSMTITVVPDSGTDQLTGIAGSMKITITADGKHLYDFEYTLPNQD